MANVPGTKITFSFVVPAVDARAVKEELQETLDLIEEEYGPLQSESWATERSDYVIEDDEKEK